MQASAIIRIHRLAASYVLCNHRARCLGVCDVMTRGMATSPSWCQAHVQSVMSQLDTLQRLSESVFYPSPRERDTLQWLNVYVTVCKLPQVFGTLDLLTSPVDSPHQLSHTCKSCTCSSERGLPDVSPQSCSKYMYDISFHAVLCWMKSQVQTHWRSCWVLSVDRGTARRKRIGTTLHGPSYL
jgi:hypothetical protein